MTSSPGTVTLSEGLQDSGDVPYNITSSDSDSNITTTSAEPLLLETVTIFMATNYLYVVFAFGLPGNIASIFTILTMPTVSSSKAHVAILALTDAIAIIFKLTYHEVSGKGLQLTVGGCKFIMFLNQFCTTFANWIVVAMTTERCLAVCFPLQVGLMYSRRKALGVLATFAIMVSAVYFNYLLDFTEMHNPDSGRYSCFMDDSNSYISKSTLYWLDATVFAFIPCALVLTGNILIVLGINRSRRAQRQLTNTAAVEQRGGGRKSREHKQITIMLIVVSAVFLILNIPNAIFYIVRLPWRRRLTASSTACQRWEYSFTARFVHLLVDMNHAINFYLYFLSMSTFRRRFLDSVRCRGRFRRGGPGTSVYRTSHTYTNCPQLASEATRLDVSPSAASSCSPYAKRANGNGISYSGVSNNTPSAGSTHSLKSFNNCQKHRLGTSVYVNSNGDKSTSQV